MTNINEEDLKLELVQVLFRHGDRTPDKSEIFREDASNTSDFKPFGFGQLTNIGKKRAFKLGEVLRDRYNAFIGQYEPDSVYAYSTFFDRCKVSLQLVLAGMFPPTPELTWNENLKWNPIPCHYNPGDKELFYSHGRDPKFPDLFFQALHMPEMKAQIEKYDETLTYLAKKTGCPKDFQVLTQLYQYVQSKRECGFDFPDWCDENILKELKSAQEIIFNLYTYNNEMKKSVMGPFLKKVVANIHDNVEKKNNTKVYLYSAHDLTVHAFLRAHDINDIKQINYSAAVVLETLRGKDDKQYVQLLYWPGEGEKFETLKLKDSDKICVYKKYSEIISPLLKV